MTTTVKAMLAVANDCVPRVTPADAMKLMAEGETLVLDVRDAPEVEKTGKITGALNVSRGLLEFRADPELPTWNQRFAKDKTVLVYCASGGRAALGGKLLQDLGYTKVYNLGSIKDWVDAGGATEAAS